MCIRDRYEQALAKANTSLATARDKHADLEKQLAAERQRQEQLKTAVDQARKAHEDAVKTYGENSDEANALGEMCIRDRCCTRC